MMPVGTQGPAHSGCTRLFATLPTDPEITKAVNVTAWPTADGFGELLSGTLISVVPVPCASAAAHVKSASAHAFGLCCIYSIRMRSVDVYITYRQPSYGCNETPQSFKNAWARESARSARRRDSH